MTEPKNVEQRLDTNLQACRREIAAAAERSGRPAEAVTLLPITKYVDAEVIRLLYGLGVRTFGESRVQRLDAVGSELGDLGDIEWHMVGHLQRNKARRALEGFACIHSVDSLRIARELISQSESRGLRLPALFVEVNAGETQKTGLAESELDETLRFLNEHAAGSCVSGLMTMPPLTDDPEDARPMFRRLRELRDDRVERELLPPTAGLSMGMSRDFQIAIEEGATIVRVGRRLFDGVPLAR